MGRLIIKIVQFIVFSLCVCVEYLFVIFRFFTHILDRYFLLSSSSCRHGGFAQFNSDDIYIVHFPAFFRP